MKRYRVSFEVAAKTFAEAVICAANTVGPNVVVDVAERDSQTATADRPVPVAMTWSVTVNARSDDAPMEVTLLFDGAAAKLLLFVPGAGEPLTIKIGAHELLQLMRAMANWPMDLVVKAASKQIVDRHRGAK